MTKQQHAFFEMKHVSVRRGDGEKDTVSDISFALYPDENLALLGPNGAGKTTILRAMLGLSRHHKGEVWAFGQLCQNEKDFGVARSQAGFVFQDPDVQLFCPTVLEDVAFGLFNQGKTAEEAYHLSDIILSDLHLSHLRDRITYHLSGGEKRLVTLATVLVMKPKVLLLDEPTNALDTQSTERLLELLQNMPQTKMFVSHDQKVVDHLATRHVYLDQGYLKSTL